jgi:hypothetical protein
VNSVERINLSGKELVSQRSEIRDQRSEIYGLGAVVFVDRIHCAENGAINLQGLEDLFSVLNEEFRAE